jgi:glyoxylase-like metal-dependent hydrolase (beta-lactamase superfamily II)
VHDPANRALVIGDATLGTTVPFADGRPAFPPTYRDVGPYLESIAALRALDAEILLTAHYPVFEGAAVNAFLDESTAYTELIDSVLTEQLRAASGPATTLELVRAAGERLGQWTPDALDYAVFPVTGNLERMARSGVIRSETTGGRRRWVRAEAR